MQIVSLDTKNIKDKETFHNEFKEMMGFPKFYGAHGLIVCLILKKE